MTLASDGTHDSYQRGSGGQSAVRKARFLGLFTLAAVLFFGLSEVHAF